MAADPLAELRGLHMPPMDLGATVAEAAAGLGLGLMLAWGVVQIVVLVSARRIPPEKTALAKLADAKDLSARAAILRDYAKTVGGEGDWLARLDARFDGLFSRGPGKGLRDALYRPGSTFDLGAFDAAVAANLKRAER